jgi:hypothetical protein
MPNAFAQKKPNGFVANNLKYCGRLLGLPGNIRNEKLMPVGTS